MQWYKYREKYLYGHSDWKYIEFPQGTQHIEEALIYKGLINPEVSKYRGVTFKKIDAPPNKP